MVLQSSAVFNSVHSFSELMARQTVSAQLVLWSGKARMTVLMGCCQITCQNNCQLPLDSCYMCETWYSKQLQAGTLLDHTTTYYSSNLKQCFNSSHNKTLFRFTSLKKEVATFSCSSKKKTKTKPKHNTAGQKCREKSSE